MSKNKSKRTVQLGDLIAAACERAASATSNPYEAAQHAAIATVKALLFTGNVRALACLDAAERTFA